MADFAKLIQKAEERMSAASKDIESYLELLAERSLNDDENTDLDEAKARFESAKNLVSEYKTQAERAQVAKATEARTSTKTDGVEERISHVGFEEVYRPDVSERSFFSDWYNAQSDAGSPAAERIRTHQQLHERANTVGDYNIPAYLTSDISVYSGRPTANVLPKYPVSSSTIDELQITTGVSVANQVTEGDAFHDSSIASQNITVHTTTVGGQWTGSIQMLRLNSGGFNDQTIFSELTRSYNQQLEAQIYKGRDWATYSEVPGLLNVASTNAVTIPGSSAATPVVTLANFRSAVSQGKVKIANGIGVPADYGFVSPGMFEWMSSQTDTTGRDLFTYTYQNPANNAGVNSTGFEGQRCVWNGITWIATAGLTGQNKAVLLQSNEIHLHEDGAPTQLTLDQPKAASGQVVLVAYNFVALNSARRPKAIAVLTGTSSVELS